MEPDGSVAVYNYSLPPPPWDTWICPLGTACPTLPPTSAPTDIPTSSPAPSSSPTDTTRSSGGGGEDGYTVTVVLPPV